MRVRPLRQLHGARSTGSWTTARLAADFDGMVQQRHPGFRAWRKDYTALRGTQDFPLPKARDIQQSRRLRLTGRRELNSQIGFPWWINACRDAPTRSWQPWPLFESSLSKDETVTQEGSQSITASRPVVFLCIRHCWPRPYYVIPLAIIMTQSPAPASPSTPCRTPTGQQHAAALPGAAHQKLDGVSEAALRRRDEARHSPRPLEVGGAGGGGAAGGGIGCQLAAQEAPQEVVIAGAAGPDRGPRSLHGGAGRGPIKH